MVFNALHAARRFEKQNFGFLATAEDFDLVCEIGYHMERGTPLTMKQLLLLDIASSATLHRRLARLRRLEVVRQRKSSSDGRIVEFLLAPQVVDAFLRYGELLSSVGSRPAGDAAPAKALARQGRRATDKA
jgi:hypothetical protein